ncbi:protein kinase [Corallococcus macrosporus]|uniref:Protein kinase n=1 Tax=Myxococcus fulvus (strain ATCC BAA-855 / HW-1) TaxID=483219 RepID=F8CNE4_MYXFH|nr:protein kinase [Corallococcus macrosporus]
MERFIETAARTGSRVDVRAEGPVEGMWDRSRLDQVVANLLGNALKFGEGRPIEISLSRGIEVHGGASVPAPEGSRGRVAGVRRR